MPRTARLSTSIAGGREKYPADLCAEGRANPLDDVIELVADGADAQRPRSKCGCLVLPPESRSPHNRDERPPAADARNQRAGTIRFAFRAGMEFMIRSCFAGRSALLDAIRWQRHVSRPPRATGRTQAIR